MDTVYGQGPWVLHSGERGERELKRYRDVKRERWRADGRTDRSTDQYTHDMLKNLVLS